VSLLRRRGGFLFQSLDRFFQQLRRQCIGLTLRPDVLANSASRSSARCVSALIGTLG